MSTFFSEKKPLKTVSNLSSLKTSLLDVIEESMNAGEIELGTLGIVIYQTLRNVYFATRFGYLDFETGKWDWELVPVVFYRIFGDKGRRWWFEIGAGMDLSIDAGLAWKLIESKKLELIGHTGITASPHGSGWYLGISIEF